ncbi:hypothetical protein KTH06_14310 [Acinetobacter ursingii]|nr:hypothetical protein [Acinetobacter ursingii]MCU4373258.1 hypothetical protein [Acinetobacter ursingii]RSO80086.1 hypothetical protein EA748_16500 [Acinetobacter ursingii]
MKKSQRKTPHNIVPSPRIDPIVHAQLNSKVDELTLQLAQSKEQISDQAKRHQARVTELKAEIANKPEPIVTEFVGTAHTGFLVSNWKTGWKWISNWMFVLIGFISVYGVPTEIVSLIPEASQGKVTAILAILGFICRFVNQSKPKALPPVTEDL